MSGPYEKQVEGLLFNHPEAGLIEVTHLFDIDNEETTDIAEVIKCVCRIREGVWFTTLCEPSDFVRERFQ